MNDFAFCAPTDVLFGHDSEASTGAMLKKHGASKVLLHYGGGSIKASGLYERVTASLKEAGLPFVELGGVQPNPRLALVRQGIELCRAQGVDFLLAVGGGSAIDSAKAIGVGVPYAGDVWSFFTGEAQPKAALPLGVVLTIPAAGSEGSNSSVITNEDGWWKRGLGTPHNRPAFAIYNPTLTYTLPPYQTACGAADIMAHVMERYFTNTQHVDYTDQLCEATLRTIIAQAPRALHSPQDYDARAEIMWASTLAHNDLLGLGRVQDWASHQIEHELSAKYDVAHGAGLAVVFPAWMRYVYKHDVMRFCRFATQVFGIEMDFFAPERTAVQGIDALQNFFCAIGLPTTLEQLGAQVSDIPEMASKVKRNNAKEDKVGFFYPLDEADVRQIFQLMK